MEDCTWSVATNRHLVHLNPSVGVGCSFCLEAESGSHLFVQCLRLVSLFSIIIIFLIFWSEFLFWKLFKYGPTYSVQQKRGLVMINFLSDTAKLAIWKTRIIKMLGQGNTSVVPMFLRLVAARMKVEFSHYKLVDCLSMLLNIWGINEVVCLVYGIDVVLSVNLYMKKMLCIMCIVCLW